jgi:hypothetical protein
MTTLLLWIVIIGFLVYAVNRYAPIPNGFKVLFYVVCIAWLIFHHARGIRREPERPAVAALQIAFALSANSFVEIADKPEKCKKAFAG